MLGKFVVENRGITGGRSFADNPSMIFLQCFLSQLFDGRNSHVLEVLVVYVKPNLFSFL